MHHLSRFVLYDIYNLSLISVSVRKPRLYWKIIYSGQDCLKQSSRILSLYYFEEWLIIFEYHEMTQFEFDRGISNPTKHEGLMKECNEITLCNLLFFFHQSELDGKLTSWGNRCFKTKMNIKLTVQNCMACLNTGKLI